jgi:nicotinamidase-related amidase
MSYDPVHGEWGQVKQELEKRGIAHLIVAGGMTEYCVDTTCRRATSLGYDVTMDFALPQSPISAFLLGFI